MADHSALNEIQIINEKTGSDAYAVYAIGKTDFLIDSSIIRVHGDVPDIVTAIYGEDCGAFRILGSEAYAYNLNDDGLAFAGLFYSLTQPLVGELRYSRFEIEPIGASPGDGIRVESVEDYPAELRIFHCYIEVENDESAQNGLRVRGPLINADAYVEHTSFQHQGVNPNGYDLYVDGSHAIAYVRADRYSTWATNDGGQIIPLAGDRPRVECVSSLTNFPLTAAAGTFENDPTGTLNIDLPCQSDLKVDVAILWYSDQVRTQSFAARVDLDGAVQSASLGYGGEPVINHRMTYPLSVCFADVAAGVHTLTIQVARFNVADGVTVDTREMTVMSDPWP